MCKFCNEIASKTSEEREEHARKLKKELRDSYILLFGLPLLAAVTFFILDYVGK